MHNLHMVTYDLLASCPSVDRKMLVRKKKTDDIDAADCLMSGKARRCSESTPGEQNVRPSF